MNTALGFEIYRGVWFIAGSNDVFNNMLRDAKTAIYDPSQKLNTFAVKSITSKNGVPTLGTGITLGSDANNTSSSSDKKIAVVNLSGVITKSGGASSKGMEEISAEMLAADTDPNVIGHLIKVNSPGGSGVAMNYMKSTMKMLTKPKVTLVPRQGMAASAGYGILCEGDWVMAESDDAEVGCHGVMWGASGVPNGQKDGNGEVNFIVV
jgi:ClpP class serine protease